ncbi:hypothetical protein ALC53_09814 [Atta colombica]|uniref:Ig-like domain-containing protein n=1 Tax=Atta colombica TaxID=520822 RepID=A0A195B609_9HYME|nr:hypothetical protein ALC53_09814 [Atta colombica]
MLGQKSKISYKALLMRDGDAHCTTCKRCWIVGASKFDDLQRMEGWEEKETLPSGSRDQDITFVFITTIMFATNVTTNVMEGSMFADAMNSLVEDVVVEAGKNVTLGCPGVTEDSLVLMLEWRANGMRLLEYKSRSTTVVRRTEQNRMSLSLKNYSLQLHPVTAADSGMYECLVNNRNTPEAVIKLIVRETTASARGSNVEGGFAVSMPKPLSKLVRKPRRIQTGFRETKRTIVVARCPGVEVNNATHHVDETGVAPRRCKSHPPRAILPDLLRPVSNALTSTRFSALSATVSSHFAIVRVYRYFIMPFSESIIYIRKASGNVTIRFQYTHCECTVNSRSDIAERE